MDLHPRLIPAAEWERISAGVLQRVRAFDRFIRDVHNGRHIVRERIIPPEVLLADPAYHRSLIGVANRCGTGSLVGAVDLLRTRDGGWTVLENRMAIPRGLSLVIQNRRLLAQVYPEVFDGYNVSPVAPFSGFLAEELRRCSSERYPLTVILSRGESSVSYFDETFLARHMGVLLARPADLIVREGKVFLKTVAGLERVEVILRKVDSGSIDPMIASTGNYWGIPGLVHCIREGQVSVVNALGSEVADNRALLPYSDKIIRYYTGESALLPTVETLHLYDRDQAEWVESHPQNYRLRLVNDRMLAGSQKAAAFLRQRRDKLPEQVVAQRRVDGELLPMAGLRGERGKEFFLRVFVLLGERPLVLPGGLSWAAHPDNQRIGVETDSLEWVKDTWVEAPAGAVSLMKGSSEGLEAELAPPEQPVPSRVGEGYYWIGRYMERARNAAHQAALLENIRLTELSPGDLKYFWPLWRAVGAAADFEPFAKASSFPRNFPALFHDFVADVGNPSSIASSLAAARWNFERIQEWISPEAWRVVSHLFMGFGERCRGKQLGPAELRAACELVSDESARFVGIASRTMLHDSGYVFMKIGMSLERIVETCQLLDAIVPTTVSLQHRHIEDDTDLTALLRLIGCLDAYRREYRSRAYLDRVIRLIWTSEESPASLLFNLLGMAGGLRALSGRNAGRDARLLCQSVEGLIERVRRLDILRIFPARTTKLDLGEAPEAMNARSLELIREELDWIKHNLERLHHAIEDLFFSHQTPGLRGGGRPVANGK